MTPFDCAKSGTEDAEQTALFCWAQEQILAGGRGAVLKYMFAIPNGGSRGGTKSQAMAVGGRLKATGVKAGVADVFLPVPRHDMHGLFIEMKKSPEHGGKPKDASQLQVDFGQAMMDQGYGFCVCCGWVEAAAVITQYLGLEGT